MSERAQIEQVVAPARHPLYWSLLRVRDEDEQVVGAAFFAGEGLVCTCAHVVAEALGVEKTSPETPAGEVLLDFYRDGTSVHGKVECWVPACEQDDDASPGVHDVALLSVCEPEPDAVPGRPARLLAPRHLSGHPFMACGFPGGERNGVWAHGEFWEQRANGTFQIESPGTTGFRVQPGFSGAPIWDARERGVVGMVVTSWRDAQARAAFVIPVHALIDATDRLRVAGSSGPFAALTTGLSAQSNRAVIAFLHNYVGTLERPAPFGGRRAEIEALDSWLSDPERPYRLVVAPAGQGKSTLLANWAMEVAESGRADVILAPISLRFGTNQLVDLERIVRDRLRDLLPGGEHTGELDIAAELAQERDPRDRPLLLVFDSIDEASGWRPEIGLPLPPYRVPGIRAMVSARVLVDRGAGGWLDALGWRDVADTMGVGALDTDGIRDVLTTLSIETPDDAATDALVAALYDASDDGDPLLVGLFASAIGPGGFVTADTLPSLTGGLGAYFDLWWEAQREHWTGEGKDPVKESERATLLFGMLASALGPLTLDELSHLTGITSAAVLQEHLTEFGRWVIAVGGDGQRAHTYAFAHSRLDEYWREQKMTVQERERADRGLRKFCEQQLQMLREGADPGTASPYALRYYATHLENEHADYVQFDALVCPEWWDAHRAVTGSDETFLRDIWVAWAHVERLMDTIEDEEDERAGELIGKLFRYTLIATSLHSLSSNIPGELLAHLIAADPQRWTPQWAIEQARRHNDRCQALAALVPHLHGDERAQLLSEALTTAQTINDDDVRARALMALVPLLSGDQRAQVLSEALTAAQAIDDEHWRAEALGDLAPLLPEELLSEALTVAQAIDDEYWRASALVAMAPLLPKELLGDALTIAQAIYHEYWRVRALVVLALRLSGVQRAQVLSEALTTAQAIDHEESLVGALVALAPLLPEVQRAQVLSDALTIAQTIDDVRARVRVLVTLAPLLPEVQRAQVSSDALTAAQTINNEDWRAEALRDLAPLLAEELLSEALTVAQAIDNVRARANVLVALAALGAEELSSEALTAARAINNAYWRMTALVALVPRLSGDQRAQVLSEALTAAQTIDNEYWRVTVLVTLAPRLSEVQRAQVLSEALTAAQAIDNEGSRVALLAVLAPQLPEVQRAQVLSNALTAARTINDTYWRARALVTLVPLLSKDQRRQVLCEALTAAQAIEDEYWRVRMLRLLAPLLPEDLLSEALTTARAIDNEHSRAEVLVVLALLLPEDQRRRVLNEAWTTAQAIEREYSRARALVALALLLPEDHLGELLSEALTAAQAIEEEYSRARALVDLAPLLSGDQRRQVLNEAWTTAQAINRERVRAEVLVDLAPLLPEVQRAQVLSEALTAAQAIEDENWRASALVAMAPLLPEELLSEALTVAQTIDDVRARVRVLVDLAPRLPEVERAQVLSEALTVAQTIEEGYSRVMALVALAPPLSTLPVGFRRRLARKLLRLIASGSQVSASTSWSGLDELIASEGAAACSAVASSVIEVTRWSSG